MENKRYTECYIAFLDILGFKKMIEKKSSKEILSVFEKIDETYKNIHESEGEEIICKETIDALKIKVMSDSICFYIEASKPNALLNLMLSCLFFQDSLLGFSEPILLRGAIVRGELYARDDILFGPGLTQAYLMEKYNAKYPRIIITNDVLDDARRENKSDAQFIKAINTRIVFRDFDAFYAINFIAGLEFFDNENGGKKIYKRIEKKVSHILNSTIDESIREKYLYLEKILKEHSFGDGDSNV